MPSWMFWKAKRVIYMHIHKKSVLERRQDQWDMCRSIELSKKEIC